MGKNIGEKLLWVVLTTLLTLGSGYLILSKTQKGDEIIDTRKAIEKKADLEFVIQQDNALEKDLDTYKADHVITHSLDNEGLVRMMDKNYEAQDAKLDLIVKLIEAQHSE